MTAPATAHTITVVTRNAIFDELRLGPVFWAGKLPEPEFLQRVFDLSTLGSSDSRFPDMKSDIWQHRENNLDWPEDWVFDDDRLDLARVEDGVFLKFLCEILHPVVRKNEEEVAALLKIFNAHLAPDGWQLVPGSLISTRPAYVARRMGPSARVVLPENSIVGDVLTDEYVRELSDKCDARLALGDFEGAITVGRTLLEAVLSELELRLVGRKGDHKGDLQRLYKSVAKQLRIDEERADLDDNFKQVVRGLVQIVNGLTPIRNKMSDGHSRERKPALHHARMIVNAAKTAATFLAESYSFQRENALLPDLPLKKKEPA